MKSFGIKPNAHTHSTLLQGLCNSAKMTEAKEILKEMAGMHLAP